MTKSAANLKNSGTKNKTAGGTTTPVAFQPPHSTFEPKNRTAFEFRRLSFCEKISAAKPPGGVQITYCQNPCLL